MNVLDSPPKEKWTGKYETIGHLMKEFKIPIRKRRQVMNVLREVCTCKKIGRIYDDITYRDKEGAPCLIKTGSSNELIISDWME